MDEFELISSFFKPLARGYDGSLGLTDDAALITPPPGCELVVTTDAICSGIHFIGTEDAALIAQKLLRVNLSDLAAMGAKPLAYVLSLQLPKDTSPNWVKSFAQGLHSDQEQFGIHLAGGDTTSSYGPLSCSITAFGSIPAGNALKRSGAKEGDAIYVTGTLGDSAMGLGLLQKRITHPLACDQEAWLIGRYFMPQPRVTFGQGLIGIAHSAMDISDGLVQDLGHICAASGVGAVIGRHLLPLSDGARSLTQADESHWEYCLGGGDDYELLFTAAKERNQTIQTLAAAIGIVVTPIGFITEGTSVQVEDEQGNILLVPRKGFAHF